VLAGRLDPAVRAWEEALNALHVVMALGQDGTRSTDELLPAQYHEPRRHAARKMAPAPADDLLALNEALDRFAVLDPQSAELVKLRYFAGLTLEEAAEVLGVSLATAKRWWAYARAWLYEEVTAPADGP
jgi:DNA-directed RNA polymerase specialized sigma24 family protein